MIILFLHCNGHVLKNFYGAWVGNVVHMPNHMLLLGTAGLEEIHRTRDHTFSLCKLI